MNCIVVEQESWKQRFHGAKAKLEFSRPEVRKSLVDPVD